MPFHERIRTDRGSTLVVAIMVMSIAAGLSLVVTSAAISQNRSSGVDRQRTVGVAAAEAGIDATYAAIQSSALNLPCRWPATGSADVKAFPDATQVVTSVSYYASAGGAALPCSGGTVAAGSLSPTSALITSTSTTSTLAGNTTRGVRTMQANVNLVRIAGAGFSKAIFGQRTIIASNHSNVTGSAGANANLYTNGDFICSNNQNYAGSIIAPRGSISLDGCSVAGDGWARDEVVTSGNVAIGGKVISSGGAVSLSGNTSVGGTVLAAGAIAWSGCSALNKCFANQGSAAPPAAYEQFPVLRGDAAALQAWADAGYTVVNDNVCGTASSFGDKIKTLYAPLSGKTLLRTTCPVQFQGTKDIDFGGDFALFANGGISTSNQVTLDSTGTLRNVYLVVPYDAAVAPCASPGISTDNNFGSTNLVNLLVYSPCNVSYSNNGDLHGQIYSGSTMQIDNNFSLTFVQMPVFGIDPASLPALSYTVDILYKREVPNPSPPIG